MIFFRNNACKAGTDAVLTIHEGRIFDAYKRAAISLTGSSKTYSLKPKHDPSATEPYLVPLDFFGNKNPKSGLTVGVRAQIYNDTSDGFKITNGQEVIVYGNVLSFQMQKWKSTPAGKIEARGFTCVKLADRPEPVISSLVGLNL